MDQKRTAHPHQQLNPQQGLRRKLRLAYFVSHPIQYQAPLLRRIAQEPGIELTVFFGSDHSVRGYLDEGFKVQVAWDVPLLEGYRHEFLPRMQQKDQSPGFARPLNYGIFGRLEAGSFDVVWVHGYSTATSLQAMLSANTLRIPVLLRAESTLIARARTPQTLRLKQLFFRMLRQHIAAVLAIGTANARYWRHYMGEDLPIFRMPYAVDNAFFQSKAAAATPAREAFRQELGLERGRPVILFASKLQERKRCSELVEAYRSLIATQALPAKPYLLIVGDGEERARLEAQAAADPGIRLLGFRNQSELPRFFDLCDCFVLPSVHETWGLVVNEAMNAGRAVVVSEEIGCQEDLVVSGGNGWVFPAGNIPALAEALSHVLASPEVTARMGAESRRIIESYSFEQDVQGLREALAFCVPGFGEGGGLWSPSLS